MNTTLVAEFGSGLGTLGDPRVKTAGAGLLERNLPVGHTPVIYESRSGEGTLIG